jgi:hypothetical protein
MAILSVTRGNTTTREGPLEVCTGQGDLPVTIRTQLAVVTDQAMTMTNSGTGEAPPACRGRGGAV